MNPNDKKNQIKRRFIPLVAALCSVCLLLSAPAQAGPTTGQLQQQIDELTAHVNRLRTLIEDPNNKSYNTGIAAVSDINECLANEAGFNCDPKKVILIDVLEGQLVVLDVISRGPPEETVTLEIEKLPSQNPLSSRDYRINVKLYEGSDVLVFNVSPDDPVYARNIPKNPPLFRCELVTDWRIKIIIRNLPSELIGNIKPILTESLGVIMDANIVPYTESATETELKVSIKNYGDVKSTYIVTATGFGPSIEPVVADSVTLEPGDSATLTLPIRTVDTFAAQGPCLVRLKSNTGRIYDHKTADFPAPLPDPPPPSYIPDFDGDGDVDFGDFSHFGKYWLEQANP